MHKKHHDCNKKEEPPKHRGKSAKNFGKGQGHNADDSMTEEDTEKMNDIASPKMQKQYHEFLKVNSLKPMFSRAGKNTMNHHFEFMKA